MSKVITFSRQFPSDHKQAGQSTFFVEKILNNLRVDYIEKEYLNLLTRLNPDLHSSLIFDFWTSLNKDVADEKRHTIRNGVRFEAGELFSPRAWLGKPYRSKRIIFAEDIEVNRVLPFNISYDKIHLDNIWLDFFQIEILAKNDGLTYEEFMEWFKYPCNFNGSVIIWCKETNSKFIEY